jgi:hypothetical protein
MVYPLYTSGKRIPSLIIRMIPLGYCIHILGRHQIWTKKTISCKRKESQKKYQKKAKNCL